MALVQTFPTEEMEQRYVYVCIDVGMIRFVGQALNVLMRRSAWRTEADFQAARQALLKVKEALMSGCDSRIVTEGFVMLAKALSLNYTEPLEAPFPALSQAIYDAEQADTAGAMDAIHRFGELSPTQQTENNANFEALFMLLTSLLTDGTITPAMAMTIFSTLKAGGGAAEALLQNLLNNSIGLNSNQNEYFLRDIAGLIGGAVGLPPLDQP